MFIGVFWATLHAREEKTDHVRDRIACIYMYKYALYISARLFFYSVSSSWEVAFKPLKERYIDGAQGRHIEGLGTWWQGSALLR